MKFNLKARVLSAVLASTILLTACGNTTTPENDTQNTEVGSVEVESEMTEEPEVTIEKEENDIVTSPVEPEEPELTEEEQKWQNLMMADIKKTLNVRVEANADAELAGKLEKGDVATVLEIGEEWTKIESGKVVGYVINKYCVYGLDALAYAKENCDTVAVSTVDGLRIREKMDAESKVITTLKEGAKIEVDTEAVTEEGWVAVKYNKNTYYVSAEYVNVDFDLGTATTIAEIKEAEAKAAKKAAEEAKKKEEAAKKTSSSSKKKTTKAELAELDDVTLLAAIIYCEADGASYECKLAVASVVMNRLNSDKFPNTLAGVLAQSGQFPPAVNGKLMNRLNAGKISQSYYDLAREVLAGKNNGEGHYYFNDYNGTQSGMRIDGMIFW